MSLNFDWRLITLKITDVIQAVSLSVLHNSEWHYLVTGVNFKDFSGLGKYLVKVNLEAAIDAKADIFDAGLGDCGWKNLWHFDKISQYNFEKNK
jgi:CelD/BcsL family acetyltransferase involved in cellulose biosynthesis